MTSPFDDRTHNRNLTNYDDIEMTNKEGVPSQSPLSVNGELDDPPQLCIYNPDEDSTYYNSNEQDRRRSMHNAAEKKRKDKIRAWITKLGDLLPYVTSSEKEKQTTVWLMEQIYVYVMDLQESHEKLLFDKIEEASGNEILKLREELMQTKFERDKYQKLLKQAGAPVDIGLWCGNKGHSPGAVKEHRSDNVADSLPNGDGTATENKDEEHKTKHSKAKKKNTISAQLENKRNSKQSENYDTRGILDSHGQNMMSNIVMGGPRPAFLNSPNMLFNPSVMPAGQMLLQGSSMSPIVGMHQPGMLTQMNNMFGSPLTNVIGQGMGSEKNAAETAGAGLLQLAMQDAGITPGNNNSQQGSIDDTSAVSSPSSHISNSVAETSTGQSPSAATALHTLASVATSTQNVSIGTAASSAVPSVNPLASQSTNTHMVTMTTQAMNSNIPIMSTGQNGYSQMLQSGNPMMSMPLMGGSQGISHGIIQAPALQAMGATGPAQQGQIVFLNEQGVPVVANVPFGVDPNNLTFQKQNANQNQQPGKDQLQQQPQIYQGSNNINDQVVGNMTTGIGQQVNMNSLQQQQINNANAMQAMSMQPQTGVGVAPGGTLMPQQLNLQLPNGQQIVQPMQNQLAGMPANGLFAQQQGLILPVSQSGSLLTLNAPQPQQNQLPSALILPNGQIIPVVSNPQMVTSQANNPGNNGMPVAPQHLQHHQQQQQQMASKMIAQNAFIQSSDGTVISANLPGQVIMGQGQVQFDPSQAGQPMGLLMTAVSNFQTTSTVTTSMAALTTSVAPTSSTQSQMTAEVAGSSNVHSTQVSISDGNDLAAQINKQDAQCKSQQIGQVQNGHQLMMNNSHATKVPTSMSSTTSPSSMTGTLMPPGGLATPVSGPGSMAPIVLSVPCNGQPTSILVDPTTMQVLGTVQNPPVTPQPCIESATVNPVAKPPSKKSKKGLQRAICPKPLSTSATGQKVASNKSDETMPTIDSTINSGEKQQETNSEQDSMPDFLNANNNDDSASLQNSESGSSTTDILAKAAESIFSTGLTEISPSIAGFYNPANEDNPLHIDTSAGETEDDGSASPIKEPHDGRKEPETINTECKTIEMSESDMTTETPIGQTMELHPNMVECETVKEKTYTQPKKNKKSKMNNTKKDILKSPEPPHDISEKKSASKCLTKNLPISLHSPLSQESVMPELISQSDLERQVIHLPDTIIFTESELSSVLDTVENLGKSLESLETPKKKTPNKSKKTKSQPSFGKEPVNKKQKRNPSKDRMPVNNITTSESQSIVPKSLSVYDFDADGSDDIVSPIISLHSQKTSLPSMPMLTSEDNLVSMTTTSLPIAVPDVPPKNKVNTKVEPSKTKNKRSSKPRSQKPGTVKSAKTAPPAGNTELLNQQFELFSPSASVEKLANESDMKVDETNSNSSIEIKKDAGHKPVTAQKELTDSNIMSVESHASSIEGILSPTNSTGTDPVGLDSRPSSVLAFGAMSPHLTLSLQNQPQNSTRQSLHNLPQRQRSASPVSVPSLQSVTSSSQQDASLQGNDSVSRASPNSHCSSITNFSSPSDVPYSAESLFNSPNKPSHSSKLNHPSAVTATIGDHNSPSTPKPKNNIYSAENFVHSSRSGTVENGAKNSSSSLYQPNVLSPSLPNSFNRMNTDSSDSFNFASIGMNLTSVSSTGSFMDNLNSIQSTVASSSVPSTSSSFTFTLSSTTSTSTSSSSGNMTGGLAGHHQFPFYPPLHLHGTTTTSASDIPSSQQQPPMTLSSFNNDIPKREINMPSFSEEISKRETPREMSSQQNVCANQRKIPKSQAQSRQNSSPFSFALEGICASRDANIFSDPSHINSGNMQQVLEKSSHSQIRNSHKRFPEMNPNRHMPSSNNCENRNMPTVDHMSQVNNSTNGVPPYFSQPNFQPSQSLNTPPLHHPPLPTEESRTSIPGRTPYDTVFSASNQHFNPSQPFPTSRFEQSPMPFTQREPGSTQPLTHRPSSSDGRKSVGNVSSKSSKQPSPMNPQQTPQMSGPPSSHSSRPTPPQTVPHQPSNVSQSNPSQQHSQQQAVQQTRQSKSASRSSKQQSQKKSNKQYPEVDSNLSHSIFEANRSLTPYFSIQNLSPPPRNMQNEGPAFFHGNIFGPGPRPTAVMPKNGDISTFNQLFQPSRPQNGLGINFQTGFAMNPVHGNHSNAPQITPHTAGLTVTPHVPNFNLSNIFSDTASQNEGLNISPIKFPHTNSILPPQPGMDPNSLHHPQQGRPLYHNRNHPPPSVIHNAMSINSILGHNPHGFDGRPMGQTINSSVAPPFHGHPPSFAMPPLNFSMHDH